MSDNIKETVKEKITVKLIDAQDSNEETASSKQTETEMKTETMKKETRRIKLSDYLKEQDRIKYETQLSFLINTKLALRLAPFISKTGKSQSEALRELLILGLELAETRQKYEK